MLQIIQVELKPTEHLLHRVGIAVVERRIRGHTRADLIEILIARVVLHDLVYEVFPLGSVPHKGHIADKNIPKLRQLVEMVSPEKFPYPRHPRIVLVLIERRSVLLGIHPHAPELIDIERLPVESDALLTEDGGRPTLNLQQQEAQDHERGKQDKTAGRKEAVGDPLDPVLQGMGHYRILL